MGESRIAIQIVLAPEPDAFGGILMQEINACVVTTAAELPDGYVLTDILFSTEYEIEAAEFAQKLDGARPVTCREVF